MQQRSDGGSSDSLHRAHGLLDFVVQADLQPPPRHWRNLRIVIGIASGLRLSATGFPPSLHTFAYKVSHKEPENTYQLTPDISATEYLNEPQWDTDSEITF